jgi:DNA-binding transcriptional LysR family regulator
MSAQSMILVLPRLLNVIAASKKSISIHIKTKANGTIQKEIDAMEVDLAIGTIQNLAPRFDRHVLYHDKYVIMMAKNNPLAKRGVSAEEFPKLEQIAVSGNRENSTRIDRELQAQGIKRNVIMSITQYHVLPKVLRATSLISLIPRSIVHEFDRNEFLFQEVPFDIPEVEVLAFAHRSRRRNTAIRWLQNALKEACSDLGPLVSDEVMNAAA